MSEVADIGTEEDFRTLAENSPDIIDRFDRACRHTYVNAAGLRQLSLPAERVIGKTVRETGVPEPFCSLWEERALHVFRTAEPLEVSDTFPGPNGLTYFNSRCVPEFGCTGEVRSVLVISRDITERKKVEDELRCSEADLAEAQRLARLGNWSRDLANNSIRWSRELFSVFDVDEWELAGAYDVFLDRVHPNDRELVRRAGEQVRAEGKPFNIEYRIVTRSGEVRHIREAGYVRRNDAGELIELFGTAQDASESKRAEEALRKLNEELEDRVRERTAKLRKLALEMTRVEQKERMRIAELLHEDVQQLLVGVRFRLEQIRQSDDKSQIGAELNWVLDHLRTANEQIRHLTARLRPPILYDLGLKAAIEWLAGDMKAKFAFAVELAGTDLPQIRSDEINAFAFTAVSELLMNVVKHAGVKRACVDLSVQGHMITLKVSDRGAGFDCSSSVKENKFGLFNIRERAETLGGCLEVTGGPGQGTCAALTIPIK